MNVAFVAEYCPLCRKPARHPAQRQQGKNEFATAGNDRAQAFLVFKCECGTTFSVPEPQFGQSAAALENAQ